MNLALPPDNDWRYIAELTQDDSWLPEQMRQYFVEIEDNQYLPDGEAGHGYDGYVSVSRCFKMRHEHYLKHFCRALETTLRT